MKNIAILGSTGSIGRQTLDVVRQYKDRFNIVSLSVNTNIKLLLDQIKEFEPEFVCVYDKEAYENFLALAKENNIKINSGYGMDALVKAATINGTDILLTSVVGMIGLIPTVEAIKKHITIALANKETLVTAGDIVMNLAKENNVKILPVDSEHSAIFQCLQGENHLDIKNLIITASGGAFRDKTKEEIKNLKASEALKHPNWAMGNKITIDSATLMNKGLEIIEASYLFDIDHKNIKALIHRQSLIHSMVQFNDNSVKAQIASPDMKGPIGYALFYPNRNPCNVKELDFTLSPMTFEEIDTDKFPCINLAREALDKKGSCFTVLNSANEELVKLYLKDKIGFYDIASTIKKAMQSHNYIPNPTIDDILNLDRYARNFVNSLFK